MAGYWGLADNAAAINPATGINVHCGGIDVTFWALALTEAVAAAAEYSVPCAPHASAVTGSDVLIIRHASALEASAESDRVQLHSSTTGGMLFANGDPPTTAGPQRINNLEIHGWYVERNNSSGAAALRRITLVKNGLLQNQLIIPGVEDLQIRLGVDQDKDGYLDAFVSSQNSAADDEVLAVQLWLLLRSAEQQSGHFDTGPWQSIDLEKAAYEPSDSYRRVAIERTIVLRNRD
jgi:hypothetical protein